MPPMDEQRSRETRARAELALVRLLHALGDEDVFLVVLGGLVPEVLASDEALVPEHLGTTMAPRSPCGSVLPAWRATCSPSASRHAPGAPRRTTTTSSTSCSTTEPEGRSRPHIAC